MFGLGIAEIITVLIVILVLFNPKDLPAIVRTVGRVYGSVMKQLNGVRKTYGQFEKELKSLTDFNNEER